MDLEQLALSFVAAVIGGGVVKLWDLVAERFRQRKQYKEKKILILSDLIDEYADLAGLYQRLANRKETIVKDEHGKLLRDERGEFIVDKQVFDVNPKVEEAFVSLYGVDIKGGIEQKKLQILSKMNRILEIDDELQLEGQLKSRLTELYSYSIWRCSSSLEENDFDGLVDSLNEASQIRREIRAILNKQLKK